ncbi:MAG: DUF2791 family P-loop domain-containing protein [Thermoplasmata archaeon]
MRKKKIKHPVYGIGEVVETRHKGFYKKVKFSDGIERVLRIDENIEELEEEANLPVMPKQEETEKSPEPFEKYDEPDKFREKPLIMIETDRHKSRVMIEAFRCGIVPYDYVKDFVFGRDEEIIFIDKWLTEDTCIIRLFINGLYGSGKTHLLHYIQWQALEKKYATAWIVVDPNETPFHKPKNVYLSLMQNFKYKNSETGKIENFYSFIKDIKEKAGSQLMDHFLFRKLQMANINFNEKLFWNFLSFLEVRYLPPYSTAINVYTNLLSSWGWFARTYLGLKGLILIFDEAENIDINKYAYQRQQSNEFLNALFLMAKNDKNIGEVIPRCGKTPWKEIPFLYKTPAGLKLIFSTTSSSWENETEESSSVIKLNPISPSVLKDISKRIYNLYLQAYNIQDRGNINHILREIAEKFIEKDSVSTRQYIKGIVEYLDYLRFSK